MDNESYGQHIIFIIILMLIFFLSYCSLPVTDTGMSKHKISKKAQTRIHQPQKGEEKTIQTEIIVKKVEEVESEPITAPSGDSSALLPEAKVEEQKVETTQIDVISMENSLYKVHKKGIVQFTHKKHVEDHLISCGSCHHDETGKPLDLTINDTPKVCIDCHKETEKPKGEKLGKKEKIAKYHFEALHANCIGCHKDYNKEKGDPKGKVPAPTSCTNCHPKK